MQNKELKVLPLTMLESGDKAIIKEVRGGRGFINKLNALGIMPGKEITKLSAMIFQGPVIIKIGESQIALGYGMANKIFVRKE